jgi:hypothetical protein
MNDLSVSCEICPPEIFTSEKQSLKLITKTEVDEVSHPKACSNDFFGRERFFIALLNAGQLVRRNMNPALSQYYFDTWPQLFTLSIISVFKVDNVDYSGSRHKNITGHRGLSNNQIFVILGTDINAVTFE